MSSAISVSRSLTRISGRRPSRSASATRNTAACLKRRQLLDLPLDVVRRQFGQARRQLRGERGAIRQAAEPALVQQFVQQRRDCARVARRGNRPCRRPRSAARGRGDSPPAARSRPSAADGLEHVEDAAQRIARRASARCSASSSSSSNFSRRRPDLIEPAQRARRGPAHPVAPAVAGPSSLSSRKLLDQRRAIQSRLPQRCQIQCRGGLRATLSLNSAAKCASTRARCRRSCASSAGHVAAKPSAAAMRARAAASAGS